METAGVRFLASFSNQRHQVSRSVAIGQDQNRDNGRILITVDNDKELP